MVSKRTRGYVQAGFGLGIGSLAAAVLYLLVAAALFIPGFLIVSKQHKLPKERRVTSTLVCGYILMGLGMVVGLGFGAGTFFELLSSDT